MMSLMWESMIKTHPCTRTRQKSCAKDVYKRQQQTLYEGYLLMKNDAVSLYDQIYQKENYEELATRMNVSGMWQFDVKLYIADNLSLIHIYYLAGIV